MISDRLEKILEDILQNHATDPPSQLEKDSVLMNFKLWLKIQDQNSRF
jgi:hypothetical protein